MNRQENELMKSIIAKTSSGEKWKIEILQRKKVIGRPENDLNCFPTRRNRLVTSRR